MLCAGSDAAAKAGSSQAAAGDDLLRMQHPGAVWCSGSSLASCLHESRAGEECMSVPRDLEIYHKVLDIPYCKAQYVCAGSGWCPLSAPTSLPVQLLLSC